MFFFFWHVVVPWASARRGYSKTFLENKEKKTNRGDFSEHKLFSSFYPTSMELLVLGADRRRICSNRDPPRRGRILGVPVERFRLVFLYSVGTWRLLSKALCVFGTEECLEKGGGGRGEEERPSLNNRREENCAGPPKHLSV